MPLKKLVLIDDEPFSLKMFRDMFGKEWKIVQETTIDQIIDRIASDQINLVLLNLTIRKNDGERIFDAIQARYPRLPVVVYAPSSQNRLARALVRRGAFWYLTMPLNTDDLEHVMRIALSFQENQNSVQETRQDFEQLEAGIARLFGPLKQSMTTSFSFEADELVQAIIELLGDILQVERVSLMLVDHEQQELRIKAAKGLTPYVIQKTIKKIGEGIAGTVARDGKPLLIKDVQQDTKFSESAFYHQYTTRSLICVPLKLDELVIGVLSANNKYSGRPFDENDLYLTTIFSHLLLLTLHNAQLHYDRERIYNRESELSELSRKLSYTLEPKTLFHTILTECCSIFSSEFAFLFQIDEKGTDCSIFYVNSNSFSETQLPPALQQKWLPLRAEAKVVTAESELKEFELLKNIVKLDVRSWVCAPMVVQDKITGSLELASTDSKRFHESDKLALLRIAQQASLAIHNARLYVKLLNSLKEISEARKEVDRVRRGQFL